MGGDKRRLPVLQPRDPAEEEAGVRPAWQWVGIGGAVIFLAWMPLAYLANILARALAARRLGESDPARVAQAYTQLDGSERLWLQLTFMGASALALIIAAVAGGMVLGRFDRRAARRDATVAGALVAALASLLTLGAVAQRGLLISWALSSLVVAALAAGAARLGARGAEGGAR